MLDDCEGLQKSLNGKLWPILEAEKRIHGKKVLLVIISEKPLVMHPLFSMMMFGGERLQIKKDANPEPEVIKEIYNNPHNALMCYSVCGYFPLGRMEYVYEDNHNYHDSILHMLEYRDHRIDLLDKAEKKKFEKQRCIIYADFLNRFIRPFHQKNPNYVDLEELEEYYQTNIAPFLEDYLQSVIIKKPILKELVQL